MVRHFWATMALAILTGLTSLATLAQDLDVATVARTARTNIAAQLDEEARSALDGLAAIETTADDIEGLAIATLLNRHLDEGAYLYALATERDPGNAALMTSLGALALELGAAGRAIPSLLPDAVVRLQRTALALDPEDASTKHNLANALLAVGGDTALAEALDLLEQATHAEPDNDLFGARLAEALLQAGRAEEARRELNRVFLLDPASLPVAVANADSFDGSGVRPPAGLCSINFNCRKACPGGIIGGLNYVSCEMENASAVSACEAGQPFPTSFDCEAKMPRFGILIPGLDPGFSILTPWGSLDMLVQGDGRVDVKVRVGSGAAGPLKPYIEAGPLKPYLEGKGSFQPSRGELRFQGGGGVSLGLPATNNPAVEAVNSFGLGPSIRVHYNNSPNAGEPDIEPSVRLFRGKILG